MKRLSVSYVSTRESLHAVAERVMSAASYASIEKIGLRPHIGGFATQEFDGRIVAVENGVLVDGSKSLPLHGATLRTAAELLGVELDAKLSYTPTTALPPDKPLDVDRDSATFLGHWYWFITTALNALTADIKDASTQQIWPEHFDLACDFGSEAKKQRGTYGGSPGDTTYPEPYLYVTPWDADAVRGRHPDLFVDTWGATLHYKDLLAADNAPAAAIEFFQTARATIQA